MNAADELKSLEVELSPAVELRPSPLGGLGVFASQPINVDDILLKVPKDSVLSPRTCAASQFFDDFEQNNDSFYVQQELLMAAYLFEKSQGEESPWYRFIKIIERGQVPDVYMLWTPEEQDLLEGTNIDSWEFFPDLEVLGESYQAMMPLFQAMCVVPSFSVPTFDEFIKVALIVASRAFDVDNYHELALVPGACFFNHGDLENAHFEAVGDVCDLCGEIECHCIWNSEDDDLDDDDLDDNDHDEGENAEASDTEQERAARRANLAHDGEDADSDFSLMEDRDRGSEEAMSDIGDDDDTTLVDDSEFESDFDSSDESEYDPYEKFCTIRAIRDIPAGSEVFNIYGEDPNGVLIPKYGFAIKNNRHEVINFEPEIEDLAHKFDLEEKFYEWRAAQEARLESAADDELTAGAGDDLDEDADEDEEEDEVFLGLLNENDEHGRPKVSEDLKELSECFELDFDEFVQTLVDSRMKKYRFDGNSEELFALAEAEKNPRRAMALIAVASEKNILERYTAHSAA